MKSPCLTTNVCDVISVSESALTCSIVSNQMNKESETYRDEDGAPISATPCGWEEAKRKIEEGRIEFGRSVETMRIYRSKIKSLSKEWISLDDYCKHAFLGYPATVGQHDGCTVKRVDPSHASSAEEVRIVKNEFPYNFSRDIEHHVLWTSRNIPQSTNHPLIQSRFPSSQYDVLMFENVKANKSVKSVAHVHLLVRLRDLPWQQLRFTSK